MGNLKLLDVVIGLVLMMSITSLAASTLVEAYAALTKQRAKQLKDGIERMLWGGTAAARPSVADTDVVRSLSTTPAVHLPGRDMDRPMFPSYLSPAAFIDLVQEVVTKDGIADPSNLEARHGALSGNLDAAAHRALEQHYDEAMDRLTGMYKRWSGFWLFVAGLAIAVIGNVSIFHAAQSLWSDGATRDAVVAAAQDVHSSGDATAIDSSDLTSVGSTVEQLQSKSLPVGWTAESKADWGAKFTWGRAGIVVGWLVTAMLVTLGAPFWFDLLGKLISLRSAGKPKPDKTGGSGGGGSPDTGGEGEEPGGSAPVKKAAAKKAPAKRTAAKKAPARRTAAAKAAR